MKLFDLINDRGIALDLGLVTNAIAIDARSKETLTASLETLTGLDNPNSIMQMRKWLQTRGLPTESLDKKVCRASSTRPTIRSSGKP